MLLFSIFLVTVSCSMREILFGKRIQFINNLTNKTVVLVEVELYYRTSSQSEWLKYEGNDSIIHLQIYTAQQDNWELIDENGQFLAEYNRQASKTNFFFTTPEPNYFLFEIGATVPETQGNYQYALKTAIYEGKQKDPRIVSHVDLLIIELAKHVDQASETMKEIRDAQKLDFQNDLTYKSLISSIKNIVISAFLVKIIVFYCMYYVFNKKLIDFFHSKKIVAK